MTYWVDLDSETSCAEMFGKEACNSRFDDTSAFSSDESLETFSDGLKVPAHGATDGELEQVDEEIECPSLETWPVPLSDENVESHIIPILPTNQNEVRELAESTRNVLVRVITWNQEAQPHPTSDIIRKYLIPLDRYHVIAIGTQECENSIAKSLINPSKAKWEEIVSDAVGSQYSKVCDHILQATYL